LQEKRKKNEKVNIIFYQYPLGETSTVIPHPPGRKHVNDDNQKKQQGVKPVFVFVQIDKSENSYKQNRCVHKEPFPVGEHKIEHMRVQEIESFFGI